MVPVPIPVEPMGELLPEVLPVEPAPLGKPDVEPEEPEEPDEFAEPVEPVAGLVMGAGL